MGFLENFSTKLGKVIRDIFLKVPRTSAFVAN